MRTGSIGFLGIGTLATAMVRGLRRRRPDLLVHLSPRSEAASRALSADDGNVRRHSSNGSVVDESDIVVLTMRPPQLEEAFRGVSFRRDQVVASCVAGTPLAEVGALVAPAAPCRLLPLPMIEHGEGPLVLYPSLPSVRDLFQGLSVLIDAPDEAAFGAYMTGSAVMSTYFTLQEALARWLRGRGIDDVGSATYVRSLLGALAQTSARTELSSLPSLPSLHETLGGLNQRVRRHLEESGWFDSATSAYDAIADLRREHLRSGDDT